MAEADPSFHTVFTYRGKIGAAIAIFLPHMQGQEVPKTVVHCVQGSAQFKELYAIVLALKTIQGPFSLFTNSLYLANLLPNLPCSHIKPDDNPITPLMIQTRNFLKSRTKPIFLQHLQGHQHLPGILSQGNAIVDSLASSSQCYLTQDEAISFHDLTHVNWRGLQH